MVANLLECCDARCRKNRPGVVSALVLHGRRLDAAINSAVIEHAQYISAADKGRTGIATRDDLRERGEIGRHAIELLRTTRGAAEAADHFIENQQHTMARGRRA